MNTPSGPLWERRNCVSAEVEGSLVLLDLDSLIYHALNSTASAIWQALETPSSANSIADYLQERFDVDPAQCRASVDRMLAQLETQHLIALSPAVQ